VPRIRTLKPEHKVHRKVGRLDDRTYRLWVGLITEADDEGRFVADADQLRVVVYPYQRLPSSKVDASLSTLASVGLVTLYQVNGTRYGCFPDWEAHQRISHGLSSKLPPCSEDSRILTNPLEDSVLARARGSGIRDQGSGIKDQGSRRGVDAERLTPPAIPATEFQIPESITKALGRSPRLHSITRLHLPSYWQSQIRARPGVDFAAELLKAEAWCTANPTKAPRSDVPAFLSRWFAKAAERLEAAR